MEIAYVKDWEHVLEDTLRAAGDAVQAETRLLRKGSPADAILEEARSGGYDLIVLGSRGADSPGDKGMGSVAARVGAGAHCSVLVIR
jgi:nucleotide-binding universal stress UspA family protein